MLSTNAAASLLAATLLAGAAGAQTNVPEIEPNQTKTEATLAPGLVAGDTLTGTTTGTSVTPGLTTDLAADTWRVRTASLPLGIYRHTLALTTSGTAGHTGSIRGLNQVNGVIGALDNTFQTSITTGTPPRSNTWYGFGLQEEVYYRVTGVAATTSPYVVTLSTVPVTPLAVAGAFVPGNITVTTVGQGHTTDTEIYVYDGNLQPVPLGHNDGSASSSALSTVIVNLPAGTYYVAVARFNTSNNQSDLNPTEGWDDDTVLDFPNAMACSSTTQNSNVAFAVSDGTTTTQQPATMVNGFDIVWARFTVGNPSTPTTAYCFGDGTGTACPCGNVGTAGNGCPSSVNANGGNLAGSGVASIASDSFVLTGTGMPSSSALYFQGTARVNSGNGNVFGDGLRCAGGSVIRLGTKTNVGGTSSYPTGSDPSISVKGANSAGNVRDYQCWYRNAAAFCNPETYNLTNGLEVTWTN